MHLVLFIRHVRPLIAKCSRRQAKTEPKIIANFVIIFSPIIVKL